MDELIQAMSDEDLAGMKDKYANNSSVVTLIDGILATRVKEAEEVKAKVDFAKGLSKMFAKLPHPEDVHNIFARWGEVDVPNEGGEPEVVAEEVCKANGLEVGTMRVPTHKENQWLVEVNHATRVTSTSGKPATSKRAITVMKHNPDGADEVKGNYASASKACEALGLTIGGDSANRVLTREGFYTKPYEGSDYTS